MPEPGEADHVWGRHIVVKRDLDMELEPPARPVAVLWTDDHVEVRENIWIIELNLDTRWLVLLQLLYLQIGFFDILQGLNLSRIPLSLTIYL